jgi:ferritin-like metal-binding protein YciE
MAELSAGNAKLVQYLNEVYGVEKRLETALEAHIAMTTKASYTKRLRQHLTETKRHAREVEKRIRQLGGVAETLDTPGPGVVGDAAQAVVSGAQKAVALAQGPIHALRGTSEPEKMLKNAKTEYTSESEEIAAYTAIEKLADALGDKETQRLARAIRREEERMRSFLEKEIPRLTTDVAKAEIPASQRRKATRGKKASRRKTARAKASASSSRAKAAGARKPARAKAAASRKPARAKAAASRKAGRAKTTASRKAGRAKASPARRSRATASR